MSVFVTQDDCPLCNGNGGEWKDHQWFPCRRGHPLNIPIPLDPHLTYAFKKLMRLPGIIASSEPRLTRDKGREPLTTTVWMPLTIIEAWTKTIRQTNPTAQFRTLDIIWKPPHFNKVKLQRWIDCWPETTIDSGTIVDSATYWNLDTPPIDQTDPHSIQVGDGRNLALNIKIVQVELFTEKWQDLP